MKRLVVILSILVNGGVLAQNARFDIRYSEPLAVFVYVSQLSASQPSDNPFKKQFSGSVYNREKYKQLLSQFDTLRINYTYDFPGFPYGSRKPGSTEELLKRLLINSPNLREFKKQAFGILPNTHLLLLSSILYEFQLVYRELVYQPNKARFEKQLNEFREFSRTKHLPDLFDKGLSFYKPHWDNDFTFGIALYPVPGSQAFSAEAFLNQAVCGLTADTKDYAGLCGVMMHEIFHVLYNEQAPQLKQNIYKWFSLNPSRTSTYAYLLLNEVLATAMGNGFVYESLNGKKDEQDWYNRKYTDLLARKIYPMLTDYLSQKKGIDQGFVNIYTKFYDEQFSDWLSEMDNLMAYRYVLSDEASDFRIFSRFYPYCSMSQYEDEVSESSIDRMRAIPLTKVILISKENEQKLTLVKKKFPELKDWKFKAKQDFFHTVFLEDKTWLLLVNTVKSTAEQMFNGRIYLPPPDTQK